MWLCMPIWPFWRNAASVKSSTSLNVMPTSKWTFRHTLKNPRDFFSKTTLCQISHTPNIIRELNVTLFLLLYRQLPSVYWPRASSTSSQHGAIQIRIRRLGLASFRRHVGRFSRDRNLLRLYWRTSKDDGRVPDGRPEPAAGASSHFHPGLLHVRHFDSRNSRGNVHPRDAVLYVHVRNNLGHHPGFPVVCSAALSIATHQFFWGQWFKQIYNRLDMFLNTMLLAKTRMPCNQTPTHTS